MAAPRRLAVDALVRIHRDKGYSNIVLFTALESETMTPQDKALFSRLVYGVVERRLTLDYCIDKVSSVKMKKMHPTLREIMRVGAYQLLYMDKIPPSAAVNESVKLAKSMGQGRASGLVNAVLRNIDRQRDGLFENLPQGVEGDAIRYSVPAPWIAYWQQHYGEETTTRLLKSLYATPANTIRVNTLKISVEAFAKRLEEAGVSYTIHPDLPAALHIPSSIEWKTLAKIEENWYYYQDIASQYCCHALGAQPQERIADVCAAPGGKSFTVAQYMQNEGSILAADIYPHKCEVIANRAAQYGITCLKTVVRDATQPLPQNLCGQFDRVICDAPCSGMGVIRRKPEIRYKSTEDFADLPQTQLQILSQAAQMVKSGGVLQYSTCTLRPEENERVVEAFLQTHTEFIPRLLPLEGCFAAAELPIAHQITLFPHLHHSDGFFIASFQKK